MKARWWAVLTAALAACGSQAPAANNPPDKVFVCKYVDTPGEGERLQTGQNPISVSVNAIPVSPAVVGTQFADAQGRSLVIAFDTGQPEPSPEDCPPPNPPPPPPTTTSTSAPTTSTSSTTTSTTAVTTSTSTTIPSTTTTAAPTTTATVATTTTVAPTTTSTSPPTPPPPVLTVNFLTPICDGDVPYLTYNVAFAGATQVQRITFVNPNGPDFTYTNLPLSGRVLWPGAVIDANGEPLDWPGWTELADGTWVQGDEWDWVRPSVTVELEVNPTHTATIGYPPATPLCNTNPPPNAPPAPPSVTTTTIPGLPRTE